MPVKRRSLARRAFERNQGNLYFLQCTIPLKLPRWRLRHLGLASFCGLLVASWLKGRRTQNDRVFYCWNLPAKVDQNLVSIASRIKREISARPFGRRLEVSWAVNLAREDFSLESSHSRGLINVCPTLGMVVPSPWVVPRLKRLQRQALRRRGPCNWDTVFSASFVGRVFELWTLTNWHHS